MVLFFFLTKLLLLFSLWHTIGNFLLTPTAPLTVFHLPALAWMLLLVHHGIGEPGALTYISLIMPWIHENERWINGNCFGRKKTLCFLYLIYEIAKNFGRWKVNLHGYVMTPKEQILFQWEKIHEFLRSKPTSSKYILYLHRNVQYFVFHVYVIQEPTDEVRW